MNFAGPIRANFQNCPSLQLGLSRIYANGIKANIRARCSPRASLSLHSRDGRLSSSCTHAGRKKKKERNAPMHPESSREITRFFAGFYFTDNARNRARLVEKLTLAGNHRGKIYTTINTHILVIIVSMEMQSWNDREGFERTGKRGGWSKASRAEPEESSKLDRCRS